MSELSGYRALVTGASSGIGADVARALARRGAALVLAARRADRLEALATELRRHHQVETEVVAIDLAEPGAAAALWARATAGGPVDILINNAGFGHFRPFGEVPVEREAEMLRLNVVTVVELAHAFVTAHRDRDPARPAYLMNVSSTAAWQPVPNFAAYSASKTFIRNFSAALRFEQRRGGVVVSCLCPGGTVTDFHAVAGAGDYGWLASASMLTSPVVAEKGVRAMLRGRARRVTGAINKLSCFLSGLAPLGLSAMVSTLILGRPRDGTLPLHGMARSAGEAATRATPAADSPTRPENPR